MMIDYLKNLPEWIAAVAQFIYEEFVDKTNPGVTLEFCHDFFSKTGIDHLPITWVALDDGQCLGTVSLYENDLPSHPELSPWLGSLVVHKDHREKGIGEKLMRRVLDEARRLGYSEIYLRTEKEADYYRKRGWVYQFSATNMKGETQVFKYQLHGS